MAKCLSTIIVLFVLIHYYSIVNAAFLVSYCGCHEYIALAIGYEFVMLLVRGFNDVMVCVVVVTVCYVCIVVLLGTLTKW